MSPAPPKRPPTHVGDRGEIRRPHTPPRGVGLTEPPENLVIEAFHARDDITARHEKANALELAEAREERPPLSRLALLEAKADQAKAAQALLADRLASNKWKRDLVDRIVTIAAGLLTGYLLGRGG